MSADRNDGGPAFPVLHSIDGNWAREPIAEFRGMTLRDYFAAKAPITLTDAMQAAGMGDDLRYCLQRIHYGDDDRLLKVHSRLAYQWADAMLKARQA